VGAPTAHGAARDQPHGAVTLEQRVEALNTRLHDLVAANADEVADHFGLDGEVQRDLSRRGVHSAGDALPVPPALLPMEATALLHDRHSALRRALAVVFDRRFGGSWSALADALRLEAPVRRYVDGARPPRWLTISRPDVVLAGDDFVIVEPNAGSSCGVLADADVQARAFWRAPVIGDFLRSAGARGPDNGAALATHLRKRLADAGREASDLVVVVEFAADLHEYGGTFELLAGELRRHGVRAEVAALEDLDISANGVAFREERCGAVYRLAAEEPDPEGNYPLLFPLLEAARLGTVVVADELEDAIAANKTVLALVSEELDGGRLPPALTAALTGFVPWTRVLEPVVAEVDGRRVDLPEWVSTHRRDLVLKPGAGFAGRGVAVGCETAPETWTRAVDAALASSEAWIVQRTALSSPVLSGVVRGRSIPSEKTFVDYGYFGIGDRVPAGVVRKNAPFGSPTRRVKLAGTGPVFVV